MNEALEPTQKEIENAVLTYSHLCACYRTGNQPSENLHIALEKAVKVRNWLMRKQK